MSTIANTASHAPSVTGVKHHAGFRVGLVLIFGAVVACAVAAAIFPVHDLVQLQSVAP